MVPARLATVMEEAKRRIITADCDMVSADLCLFSFNNFNYGMHKNFTKPEHKSQLTTHDFESYEIKY